MPAQCLCWAWVEGWMWAPGPGSSSVPPLLLPAALPAPLPAAPVPSPCSAAPMAGSRSIPAPQAPSSSPCPKQAPCPEAKGRSWPLWVGHADPRDRVGCSATSTVGGSCGGPMARLSSQGFVLDGGSIPLSPAQHLPPMSIQDPGPGTAWGPGTIPSTSVVPGQQLGTGPGTDRVLPGDGLSGAGSRIGPSNPPELCTAPSCSPWAAAVGDPPKSGSCMGLVGGHGGRVRGAAGSCPGTCWRARQAPGRRGVALCPASVPHSPGGAAGEGTRPRVLCSVRALLRNPGTPQWEGPKKGAQETSGRSRGHPCAPSGHAQPLAPDTRTHHPGHVHPWTCTSLDMHRHARPGLAQPMDVHTGCRGMCTHGPGHAQLLGTHIWWPKHSHPLHTHSWWTWTRSPMGHPQPWETWMDTSGHAQPAHRDVRDMHTPRAMLRALLTVLLLEEPGPQRCGSVQAVVAGGLEGAGFADPRCWGQLSSGGCVSHAGIGASHTSDVGSTVHGATGPRAPGLAGSPLL